jgi:selenocysteine lyase/cysteine desulfurase
MVAWLREVYTRRELHQDKYQRASAVCGIIYCRARQKCEDLAKALRDNGIGARSKKVSREHGKSMLTLEIDLIMQGLRVSPHFLKAHLELYNSRDMY